MRINEHEYNVYNNYGLPFIVTDHNAKKLAFIPISVYDAFSS